MICRDGLLVSPVYPKSGLDVLNHGSNLFRNRPIFDQTIPPWRRELPAIFALQGFRSWPFVAPFRLRRFSLKHAILCWENYACLVQMRLGLVHGIDAKRSSCRFWCCGVYWCWESAVSGSVHPHSLQPKHAPTGSSLRDRHSYSPCTSWPGSLYKLR